LLINKEEFCYLAPIAAASPDLEKQGFFVAVVFIYREYSGKRDKS
jgi:hypothetical protein